MIIIEILVTHDNVFTEALFPEYLKAPGKHYVTECCDQVCVANATACFEGRGCMNGISGFCDSMGDAPVASCDQLVGGNSSGKNTFDISDLGLLKAMFGSAGTVMSGTTPLQAHSRTALAMFSFHL